MQGTRPVSEQESIWILNLLLSAFETIECLDNIKNTNLYRHSLKNKGSMLLKELEPLANHLQLLWGIDDDTMYNLMNFKKQMVRSIAGMRPEEQIPVEIFLRQLREDPKGTIDKLGLAGPQPATS